MSFQNEHSSILFSSDLDHVRVRRTQGSSNGTVQGIKVPKTISVVWFIVKSNGMEVPRAQSLRFPTRDWTESEAQDWLRRNEITSILFEPAAGENDLFYDYENKSPKEISIALHKDIGFHNETTSQAFFDLLKPNLKTINIDINSRGGTIRDGISIYNQLRDHPARVNIKISGTAASIASVIAMAGDKIEMPDTALMMIHKPAIPFLLNADSKSLRKQASALDTMERSIVIAYKTRMDKSEDEISAMMEEETWLNAEEARELGLADKVISEESDVMDYHDFSEYKNVHEMAVNFSIDANHNIPKIPEENKNSKTKEIDMPDNVEKLETLTAENSTLTDENKGLTEKVDSLEAENASLKEAIESGNRERKEMESKTFISDMVREGRARPVDQDFHQSNMMEKEGEKLEAYKNWLKEFPPVVDTSGEEFATKETAAAKKVNGSDDELAKEAARIVSEKKCSHLEALDIIRVEKPELVK